MRDVGTPTAFKPILRVSTRFVAFILYILTTPAPPSGVSAGTTRFQTYSTDFSGWAEQGQEETTVSASICSKYLCRSMLANASHPNLERLVCFRFSRREDKMRAGKILSYSSETPHGDYLTVYVTVPLQTCKLVGGFFSRLLIESTQVIFLLLPTGIDVLRRAPISSAGSSKQQVCGSARKRGGEIRALTQGRRDSTA